MNIFTAIGQVISSLTAATVEVAATVETTARTANKSVGMLETEIDQMVAEQQSQLKQLQETNEQLLQVSESK